MCMVLKHMYVIVTMISHVFLNVYITLRHEREDVFDTLSNLTFIIISVEYIIGLSISCFLGMRLYSCTYCWLRCGHSVCWIWIGSLFFMILVFDD